MADNDFTKLQTQVTANAIAIGESQSVVSDMATRLIVPLSGVVGDQENRLVSAEQALNRVAQMLELIAPDSLSATRVTSPACER